jgi:hypothetical protein
MAAEADELHRRPLEEKGKTCLTQIGLLTEGLGRFTVFIAGSSLHP